MTLNFEITARKYAIEIPKDQFLSLLDSESHATKGAAFQKGEKTLSEKLDELPGVNDTDYDGHFGACIYLTIDADDDTPDLHQQITMVIAKHLAWCSKLKIRKDVADRRKGSK